MSADKLRIENGELRIAEARSTSALAILNFQFSILNSWGGPRGAEVVVR